MDRIKNKKDWFLFGEWHGLFLFHSCYFKGLVETIKKELGYGFSQAILEQNKNIQSVYLLKSEWKKISQRYFQEILKEPFKIEKIIQRLKIAADDLINFSKELKKKNIISLNHEKKIKLLSYFHKKNHLVWALGQIPNLLELENYQLSDYLKEKLPNLNYFSILSTPRDFSAAQNEEKDLLILARQKRSIPKLKKHWQKYSWINFGWTGPSLTYEYFLRRYKQFRKNQQLKLKLKKILEKKSLMISHKKRIIKELKISLENIRLFRILENVLYTKAYRMDAILMSYEAIQPLLKNLALHYHLPLSSIYCLDLENLVSMLKDNKIDRSFIEKAKNYIVKYYNQGKIYIILNHKIKKDTDQIRKNFLNKKRAVEIRGQIAYQGVVTGKVKIINLAKEMKKFEKGDILVSNVTDPSLLPAMKRASAFVTNMGGLTCHAAIVARELKVPCVIGTKVATQVLKDGDLVEVDANNGIVKKIK